MSPRPHDLSLLYSQGDGERDLKLLYLPDSHLPFHGDADLDLTETLDLSDAVLSLLGSRALSKYAGLTLRSLSFERFWSENDTTEFFKMEDVCGSSLNNLPIFSSFLAILKASVKLDAELSFSFRLMSLFLIPRIKDNRQFSSISSSVEKAIAAFSRSL